MHLINRNRIQVETGQNKIFYFCVIYSHANNFKYLIDSKRIYVNCIISDENCKIS